MKTPILFFSLLLSSLSFAQELEIRPIGDLLKKIESTNFTYKETGKIFGFFSIQSCLFVSEEIVIFKNYCYPVRKYPARGYTIITREWGVIDLYQEELPGGILMRQIDVSQFPVFMKPYLAGHLPEYSLSDLSGILEELYPRYNPGCWSTSFSRYNETNEANCNASVDMVRGFDEYAKGTQAIVLDEKRWFSVLEAVEARLKR